MAEVDYFTLGFLTTENENFEYEEISNIIPVAGEHLSVYDVVKNLLPFSHNNQAVAIF